MHAICLIIFGIVVIPYYYADTKSLQLVHVLFRHGERTPTDTYINDPNKNFNWPEGWGQLSNKGKAQLYSLGIKLKEHYKDFLTSKYYPERVRMESSYADRCHVSAQLLLAGLYPPENEQIWNKDLLWLPIPIHSLPRHLDNKIAMKEGCPVYENALQLSYKSDRILQINNENKEMFDYISQNAGQNIRNITALEFLYNTLEIEEIRGLALPAWTKQVYPGAMRTLAAESLAIFTDTPLMRRLKGGVLLKEIIAHCNLKATGKLQPNREIFLYSAHDISLVNVLRTLNFTALIKPGFAAFLSIELHQIDAEYFIKLFYQDYPDEEMKELQLSFCASPCPLAEFHRGLEPMIPDDWHDECRILKIESHIARLLK